ncbi:MAG TPA: choice-of-anchor tandem repeat GloVer-containing protein [Terriglobia bacterium]|nr:choice-of-anchor tandem repeat GloVer-containing protein [Terriglobia bacterium]
MITAHHRKWMSGFGARAVISTVALLSVLLFVATPSARAQTYKVLYNFACGTNASQPYYAGVVRDRAGNLYGTTVEGGLYGGPFGFGTVFKISAHGAESVLHSFAGAPTDGESPYAGLIRDSQGNLYGTTAGGGTSNNGTVFKVTAGGTETVVYSFAGKPDGANPTAALILDGAGNLYGTTFAGGPPETEPCSN